MTTVVAFREVEELCQTTRENFRNEALAKPAQFGEMVGLLFRVFHIVDEELEGALKSFRCTTVIAQRNAIRLGQRE